ncbi:MAG: hypothetical protein D6695_02890 [Planctomycetota bacterium]|nr:MAG: hypothetical protein D6695_02890 [Planctomycetota bacterium]
MGEQTPRLDGLSSDCRDLHPSPAGRNSPQVSSGWQASTSPGRRDNRIDLILFGLAFSKGLLIAEDLSSGI